MHTNAIHLGLSRFAFKSFQLLRKIVKYDFEIWIGKVVGGSDQR